VLHFCRRSVSKLLAEGQISANKVVGLGVAFPDDIQRAALPEQPPDYAMWGSVAVDTLLSDALSMPVFVENDAAAAAIGEMHFGLGQQYQSFFYILITAALGGGLVIDGRYFRGAAGRSGELGLLPRRGKRGVGRKLENFVVAREEGIGHGRQRQDIADTSDQQERTPSQAIDESQTDECRHEVDHANTARLQERGVCAEPRELKNPRREVQYGVDPGHLIEECNRHGQHNRPAQSPAPERRLQARVTLAP
jgi:hypothetical protein